ncbi:MAG: cellulase family glycosylhydrolase [Herpetosiphonaceae bacterium]|nr:cellulase family glycosylhydrolase [Herpetosiphonaceae bacterium]
MMNVKRLIVRCVALGSLLGMILLSPQPPARAQQPVPWGDKSTPFGAIVSLGNRVRADEMPAMIQLMQESGLQWNREEISWDQVQFESGGPYRWDGDSAGFHNYDRAIQLQADAGIRILGLLDYNPAWFKSKNPHPEEWLNDWGDYVYNVVARYGRDKGQIRHWEIWNEPNLVLSGYESGLYSVEDFVRVLQTARAAAKSADPNAIIVLGGVADIWSEVPTNAYDTLDYLEQIAALGAWDQFDILGLHPYRPLAPEVPAWRRDHFETMRNQMDDIDRLLDRLGRKPIWYTEMGWSTEADRHVDELAQAAWLQRFMLIAMTRPGVEKIFWYDFRNDTGGPAHYTRPINDPNEEQFHFGLLRRTFPLRTDDQRIRKPAYSALFQLTHALGGLGLVGTLDDPFDGNGIGWQRWSGGNRTVDVIWWTSPDQAPPHLAIDCACKDARVHAFDGRIERILKTDTRTLSVQPPQNGTPIWVERGGERTTGRRFNETAHTISGEFRSYWENNGGLARFGLPLTDEVIEPGPGRIPTAVQYFERNRYEMHPRNAPEFRVLLSLLGEARLGQQGVNWRALPPAAQPPPDGCSYYAETAHTLCWPFKQYWEEHGGLAMYGFPITEAFWEFDAETGAGRLVQYFERNRFEHHPENAGTPYEIQLGLLGQQLYASWGVWP